MARKSRDPYLVLTLRTVTLRSDTVASNEPNAPTEELVATIGTVEAQRSPTDRPATV